MTEAQEHYVRGREYFNNGQDNKAIAELTKAIELAPEIADYHSLLAHTLVTANNYERALEVVNQAIAGSG